MRGIRLALKWTAIALIASLALLWAGDYAWVRLRLAHQTAVDPVETISVRPVYAIARKDGKDEFDFGDPENLTCVHFLFPHLGYNPCWYAVRESRKPIPIAEILPLQQLLPAGVPCG